MTGSTGWENGRLIAKNMTFDYTATPPRLGGFTANGQIFIGSTADPDICAVPGNITAASGSGIAIVNGPGTIATRMSTPYSLGDFEFRSEASAETRTLSVTNTSNTASSQSTMLHSVAGTTAGDTWSQWTVGTSRSYAIGVDNSASQVLTMTTAAGASVNPSTATPAWTLTPATGFNYDNSGTTSFGIGFNTAPDTNYSLKLLKSSLNDFYGLQVANTNAGNASAAGVNFINDASNAAAIGMIGSANTDTNFRNYLVLNAGNNSTAGIVYNVRTTGSHTWYGDSATNKLLMTLNNTNGLVMSKTINIGTNQITTTRQTTPSAGTIGERLVGTVSQGTPVALTNNTVANIVTLSLTAGVWDVTFICGYTSPSVSPTLTQIRTAISETSATLPGALGDADIGASVSLAPVTGVADTSMVLPAVRIIKTSTSNVYGIARALFSAGNISAYGRLSAVRVA